MAEIEPGEQQTRSFTEPADHHTGEPQQPVDENRIVRERYEKAGRLKATGVNLFVNRFIPTHRAQDIIDHEQELTEASQVVQVAGRVMIVRSFGKAGFFDLRDESNKIQVYVKNGETEAGGYELYKHWLDAGDIVGVEGTIFRTKHGELS